MLTSDNQAARALNQKATPEGGAQYDPNAPRVPFPTALRLDREGENRLMAHAIQRLQQLDVELGRHITISHNWYEREDPEKQVGGRTFMGKRDFYEMSYHNKVEWRRFALGGIFAESNLTLPVARRMVRQMIARAVDFFFSTDPWFGCYPVGKSDQQEADLIEKHARWKIQEHTQIKRQLVKAIECAFIRGEAVVKTTHKIRDQIFKSLENVLVDQDGNEILGLDGQVITQNDAFVPAVDPATGQPLPVMVLERDGQTPQPQVPIYTEKLVTKKTTTYRGPDCGVVYYKDWLCPLTAEDIQSADFVAHLYDMPVMGLVDQYSRKDIMNPASTEDDVENSRKMVELLKSLASEGNIPKTGRNQPRREWGELNTDSAVENPTCEIAECYLSFDADGDGLVEEIMLVMDKRRKVPIYYDYTGNITPDGKRPFSVISVNPIDGRWHGVGGMEMFEMSQETVDLILNRRNFSESGSGRVTFWNPSKTIEGQRNPDLQFNNGQTYTLLPDAKKEEALEYVTLPEVKGRPLFEILELFMQVMQLESGVVNAMDQQFSGLPSAKLATGVRNIEKSGNEMFGLFLEALEPGITETLKRAIHTIYANMDSEEVFTVTEGEGRSIMSLTPDQVRVMDLDVSLLLTRSKSEQVLESSVQAANLVVQFYNLPPMVQERVKTLYVQSLKALQVEQAEDIIMPLPPTPTLPDGSPVPEGPDMASQEPSPSIPINDPGQLMPVK